MSTLKADLAVLLDGVHEVASSGAPGSLCVFGEGAFPVVVGRTGKETSGPVVGAGRFGNGRVVAFSHGGFLGKESLESGDSGQFVANAVRWAAGEHKQAGGKLRVGLYRHGGLEEFFDKKGFKAGDADLHRLNSFQVLVADAHKFSDKDIEAVTKFVAAGGGWITAACGWGWAQLNPAKDLRTDFPGNNLLVPMGMVWADGMTERTGLRGFTAGDRPPTTVHAGLALHYTLEHMAGRFQLSADDVNQASATITAAARSLPPSDTTFLPKLAKLAGDDKTKVLPTPKTPIKKTDLGPRLAATFQAMTAKLLPPEQVKEHPAAKNFPGELPPSAPRVSRSLTLDTKVPAWHSTGLYAPAGGVVTVEIPESAAKKKLWLRIGAHSDSLWNLDKWDRFPEISTRAQLAKPATKAASMFGGLIYIEVPDKCDLGEVLVKISGAVAAPYFVLGKTKQADWKDRLRKEHAPWAELECSKVIVTVPSSFVRTLDDPDALMKVWEQIVDLEDDLAGTAAERRRPERVVCDQQISAGYMHAGYPVMTWMDQPKNFTSKEALLKGNWGIFHELGHNHQSGYWTFDGTGEVTCNIFSLYVFDVLCGVKPAKGRVNLDDVAKNYAKHVANGKSFDFWKKEPFLALSMYVQLQDAFGWDAYKKVFAEYRVASKDELPKNDEEKRDQWMVRFSKTVGKNLGPFFQTWGVPVSQSALDEIKKLPEWMPAHFPASGGSGEEPRNTRKTRKGKSQK
ncbi:MAG: M60 family metallopeptidase [Verrucomicrobia bacterium]|nr:M60 family metallopeptidase [Verrucomicrobiota bacterium]